MKKQYVMNTEIKWIWEKV